MYVLRTLLFFMLLIVLASSLTISPSPHPPRGHCSDTEEKWVDNFVEYKTIDKKSVVSDTVMSLFHLLFFVLKEKCKILIKKNK